MPAPLALIPAGVGVASGIAQLIWGGKPSSAEKELLEYIKFRARHGLTTTERVGLRSSATPYLTAARESRLGQVARSYAASGGSGSSEAARTMGSVPGIGEGLATIEADADMQAKQNALMPYMQFQSILAENRRRAQEQAFQTIGSSLYLGTLGFNKNTTMQPQQTPSLLSGNPLGSGQSSGLGGNLYGLSTYEMLQQLGKINYPFL